MIPNSQHRLIVGDKIDPVWLRFLQSLDGKADASEIAAIATALGSPDGTVANIPDLSDSTVRILQGAGIAVTRGESGEYYIALRPLGDSGTGTFKLITRDTTGRISGSEDGSAADVPYVNTTSGLAAEDVQAALDELSDEKLDDAPSDGSTYGRKNGAWSAMTGGGGGALVGSATVSGSAADSLVVSGLDLDSDESYYVEFALKNASASTVSLSFYYSGDTTATNYTRQITTADGASQTTARVNAATAAFILANSTCTGFARVAKDIDGKTRALIQSIRNDPSATAFNFGVTTWDSTANVTSIGIYSSVASALEVGSRIKVYRVG